jgi:transposase
LPKRLGEVIGSRDRLQQECRDLRSRLHQVQRERDCLARQVQRQSRQIQELKAQLQEARRAAKRQAAPFKRRQRNKDKKKPGQKPGHPAAHSRRPAQIDERVHVPLCGCPECGGPVDKVKDLDPQVVIDVPEPIKPHVVEYINQSGWCPHCRKRVQSRHPGQSSTARGAAGVQLGPRALSLAMDLRHRVGIVYRKVAGILELFLGIYVCASALVRAAQRVAKRCEPTCQVLVEQVREAQVVHGDETGWYIALSLGRPWLWVFTTPEPAITVYAIRTSRGKDVPQEILGLEFAGPLVVDGWAGYLGLDCAKGQCLGHLLRRCEELLEVQKQGAARLPWAVKRVLLEAMEVARLRQELSPQDYWAAVAQVRGQMRALLEGQIQEPLNRRLVEHLSKHEDELWTFLAMAGVAPTNNLAEQEIRPAVLLRKLSAGNRTEAGAHAYEVLATVSRTASRNGILLAEVLPLLLCTAEPDFVLPLLTAGARLPGAVVEKRDAEGQGRMRGIGPDLRLPGGGLGRGPGADARAPPPA